MKIIKTIFILCVALCFATSCKKEVDMTLVQKTVLENADIRQIAVADAWQVAVVADSSTFVEIECSAYLKERIKVQMKGTQLEIGFNGSVYPVINSVFRAKVHTKHIEKIKVEEAAQLSFNGTFSAMSDTLFVELDDASVCTGLDYSGHNCKIAINDASQFLDFQFVGYNCEVKVNEASTCKGNFDMSFHLVADLSGASQLITFGGTVPNGMIKLQETSVLNVVQTEIREMFVDLSDGSEATVNVTESLSGSMVTASTLYYKGHPQINVNCSDDSRLIPL